VCLVTRNGYNFADRFPLIVGAIAALPASSSVVDSEAIAVDKNGLSVFDLIRYRRQDHGVTLCAFDLLELDGEDLRPTPIEVRKATLKGLLRRTHPGVAFNRHFEAAGESVDRHACALGCEGIVSNKERRLAAAYSNTELAQKQLGFGGVFVVCNGVPISLLDKSIGNQAIKSQPFICIQIFGPFHAPSGHDIAKDGQFFACDGDEFCHLTLHMRSSQPSALDLF